MDLIKITFLEGIQLGVNGRFYYVNQSLLKVEN
jgi:hypothetical protein